MSDPQQSGEASRREAVQQRRLERERAMDAGAVAPHSVQSFPRRTLLLAVAVALATLGAILVAVIGPWVGLTVFLPAVALAGWAWRQPGVDRPARRSLAHDERTRAYDDARRAVDEAPNLAADRKLELLAVLDEGYDRVEQAERRRPDLERAVLEGVGQDGAEAQATRKALESLESRRRAFIEQCGTLRRAVVSLSSQAGDGGGDDSLAAAAGDLRAEAAAADELGEALRAARSPSIRERS